LPDQVERGLDLAHHLMPGGREGIAEDVHVFAGIVDEQNASMGPGNDY
jgi:hypothetical protein